VIAPLIVRADANARSGIGHLIRSAALAQGWAARGGNAILLASIEGQTPAAIAATGVELRRLPAAHPDPADLPAVLAAARSAGAAYVACDGYHFDAEYTSRLRAAGLRTLVIDDIADAPRYDADIVLNQNIYAERFTYRAAEGTTFLLGPRYALLRREFVRRRDWQRPHPERARRLLVTMGGGGGSEPLMTAIEGLIALGDASLDVTVLAGPSTIGGDTAARAAAQSGLPITFVSNPADMPGLFAGADMALSAGGSTCWEMCFMQLPAVLVTLSDNQSGITAGLHEAGAAQHLGWREQVTPGMIRDAVGGLRDDRARREAMAARGRALVDGLGAERVASALLESVPA